MSTTPENEWSGILDNIKQIREETARVIVGQDAVIEQMLVALLCRGHCLIVGVPGLAKTLLVSTLGNILGLGFHRIQFTPDLMPPDILGSEILQTMDDGSRRFEFVPGPIFTNLLLADEINRTPPKTQAALLEAMQEKQVTVAGQTRRLEEPFIVYATQNPVEHEGTYPLPEAQLDRFFFQILIQYPTVQEEEEILRRTGGLNMPEASTIMNADKVLALQKAASEIPVPDHIYGSIVKIVQSTRPDSPDATEAVKKYVSWGAGPRAAQCLLRASRAIALLRGKTTVSMEEVKAVLHPVLRHRLILNYNATGEGIRVESIIDSLA
ncbi:MoxR family ATPase [Akkermansia glycaniphila]|uniref:AAA family ATPase n=1 Tax=Akkermansia glycaniphila TaxID=1679444 RepID=UPI001C0319F8|nr:MoxR family ATPase [Akkermansia glycaniphila]MBT9449153.1 MoxR family ATPase [Akkermansia glycaniphila]